MNKEFNGFDEMVEALEENEDMVECKECFDLVPKVDCERVEVGYICPTCKGLRTAPAQARFVDPYDSYTQDFPEVTEYDPSSVIEYEKEPGLGDALSDLIRDEYEAIDGYEAADETIQHADINEDEKDEILDTLDHIKEEEEEHIDELKELCPECDPVAEPEKLEEAADDEVTDEEAEVEEIPEEDIPEEEAEDSEENENEEVSDLDSAYEAALEIANESGVGQVFGYARKETEEFVAVEPFEVDDPEAVEDDLMAVYDDVAYAYVAYPEKELEESLFESVQLHEAEVGKTREFADKVKKKAHSLFRKHTKADVNLDDIFTKGYYFEVNNRGAGNVNSYRVGGKQINGLTARTLADAEKIGKAAAKALASSRVEIKLMAKEVEIEDPNIKKIVADKYKWTIVTYHGGTERNNVEGINKELKNLELPTRDLEDAEASYDIDVVKKQLLQTLGKKLDLEKAKYIYSQESLNAYSEEYDELVGAIDAVETMEEIEDLELDKRVSEIKDLLKKKDRNSNKTDNKTEEEGEDENLESEEDDLEQLRAKALELLGEKKDAAGYTEDSYSAYSAKYEDCLRKIKAAKKPATFKDQYIPALPRLVQQMNALLKEVEGDEDPNLDDEEDSVDPKDAAKKMLGEKKDPDGYTPESYKKYEAAYAKIIAWIEAHTKPETLTQERIDNLRKQAEAKLVAAPDDDPDLGDDEEEDTEDESTGDESTDDTALEEAKAKAREALGEKKAAEGYTEDSYAEYSENYDKLAAAIESATSEEELKKIVDQIPKLNDLLVIDDTYSEDDTFAIEIEEDPEEDDSDEKPSDDSDEGSGDEEDSPEAEDDTPEDTETTPGTIGKLSEVSEEQLKKLFTAVTGQGVGDNRKWRKTMKRMRAKLQELGESLDPNDYKPEDFITEDLQSEADAVKGLKNTTASLKSAAQGMQNMTSAMREEYHKYANPAELKAMEDIENLVSVALSNIYSDLATWGYNASETDSQCWMCQENEACLQYVLDFEDLDEAEAEDLADQLKIQLENELSAYKPVPEIEGITGSVVLPDYDMAYDDDEEGFEGITRGSILVYVTFARNLY